MSAAKTTTNHRAIRKWAHQRKPAFLYRDEADKGGKSRFFKFMRRQEGGK
jgi:hypothetical protein